MVILLVLPCAQTSFASVRKKKTVATETKKEPVKRQSKYDKLVKNKLCETAQGNFVTLHKVEGKVYFEIPMKYLEREMLLASTISEASDNNLCAIGYKPKDPMHIKFTKTDSTIFMREVNVSATCNLNEGHIREVMARSFMDPIINSFKIYCYTNDSSAFLIDMTSLFTGNSERLAPISSGGGLVEITATFNSSGSILDDIKAFDDNVTVKSYLSYSVSAKMMGMFIVKKNEPLTVKATRTLLLLPEEKMHPRISDTRIGVFVSNTKQHISTDEDQIQIYTLANRWRVEPKDVEAYKRGELVEPVKPIVYYIDDAFPTMWKEPIRKAALRWNKAFEKIGFKDVIQVRDFPKDDPNFDPDNLKYSCIRYVPAAISNAMGPSWTDPRTGEILGARISLFHCVRDLLQKWYFAQAGAVDERVHHFPFPEEVMGRLVRYLVSHEVGHTLGLRHNFYSSSTYSVEQIRDKDYVKEHGHTASIMDYARFNYVAQPGDGIALEDLVPRLGEYDLFAIEWGYRYFPEMKDEQEEKAYLRAWTTRQRTENERRFFGTEYDARNPRCQSEDLGDNNMKANELGMENLKRIVKNITDWTEGDDTFGSIQAEMYKGVCDQYLKYITHVVNNIGGHFVYDKSRSEGAGMDMPIGREQQKEALAFLDKHFFHAPEWLFEEHLTDVARMNKVRVMRMLYGMICKQLAGSFLKMSEQEQVEECTYTLRECLDDLYGMIFTEVLNNQPVTSYRRELQRMYVASLRGVMARDFVDNPAITSLIFEQLERIKADARKAGKKSKDFMTRAYWDSFEF